MSTEQRVRDEKFMRDAMTLAEGLESLYKRVSEARSAWLRADHARLRAIVDKRPPTFVSARAASANEALQALRTIEAHYEDALTSNAAYLRKAAQS